MYDIFVSLLCLRYNFMSGIFIAEPASDEFQLCLYNKSINQYKIWNIYEYVNKVENNGVKKPSRYLGLYASWILHGLGW